MARSPSHPPIPSPLSKLLFNHLDAWAVALMFSTVALLIHDEISWQNAGLLTAVALGYWFAFALNDYYDAPIDHLDERKRGKNYFIKRFETGDWRLGNVSFQSLVVTLLLLLTLLFLPYGWRGIAAYSLCLFIMWAYSAPPIRLKKRPLLDILTHAFFVETFPYLLILFLIQADWLLLDTLMVIIAALASLTAQLGQQLHDYEFDRRFEQNFTIVVGTVWARRLQIGFTLLILLITLIGILASIFPPFILPFSLILTPAVIHRLRPFQKTERVVAISVASGLIYTGAVVVYTAVFPLP